MPSQVYINFLKASVIGRSRKGGILINMNYNNFKRHNYYVTWVGTKNADGTYFTIQVVFTRDYTYPDGGEIITDPFEVKYACKTNGFDYGSLQKDYNCYFIKKNSIEWNKYLAEPGENVEIDAIERIKKTRVLVSKLKEKGIEFEKQLCDGVFCVKGDEKTIREALESAGLRCDN